MASKGNLRIQETRRRLRCRIFTLKYLLKHPCVDCGETNPVVLDFDHRVFKEHDVARLISKGRLKQLKEEVEKCEVRCANCHRIRHGVDGYKSKTLDTLINDLGETYAVFG